MEIRKVHKIRSKSAESWKSGASTYSFIGNIPERGINMAYNYSKARLANGNWSNDPEKQLSRYEKIYNECHDYDKRHFYYEGMVDIIYCEDNSGLYHCKYEAECVAQEIPKSEAILKFVDRRSAYRPGFVIYKKSDKITIEDHKATNSDVDENTKKILVNSTEVVRPLEDLFTEDVEKDQLGMNFTLSFDFYAFVDDQKYVDNIITKYSSEVFYIDPDSVKIKINEGYASGNSGESYKLDIVEFSLLTISNRELDKKTLIEYLKGKDKNLCLDVIERNTNFIKTAFESGIQSKLDEYLNGKMTSSECIMFRDLIRFDDVIIPKEERSGMYQISFYVCVAEDLKDNIGDLLFSNKRDVDGFVYVDSVDVREASYLK